MQVSCNQSLASRPITVKVVIYTTFDNIP